MSEAITPTPGPWWVDDYDNLRHGVPREKDTVPVQGVALVGGDKSKTRVKQAYANRDLLLEAGTVFHETQRTPRQLVERVKELEEVARDLSAAFMAHTRWNGEPPSEVTRARAALSKALPNTVAEVK